MSWTIFNHNLYSYWDTYHNDTPHFVSSYRGMMLPCMMFKIFWHHHHPGINDQKEKFPWVKRDENQGLGMKNKTPSTRSLTAILTLIRSLNYRTHLCINQWVSHDLYTGNSPLAMSTTTRIACVHLRLHNSCGTN